MGRPRAVIFDFNGTVSQDESILCELLMQLFAEHGRPMTEKQYFDQLAGLSDPEIVRTWLGADNPALDEVIEERIRRYRVAVADGSTVPEEIRAALRYAADRVPLAIVSGAARTEIMTVAKAAGITELFEEIVAAEDVEHGKPEPDGYLRALALLDGGLAAGDVLVFEDSEAGIASAKAAGMRCIAVLGTLAPERLAGAEEIVERIDVPLLERILG